MLVFEANPAEYLNPLIQTWPTASPSAESLLIRREGDDVVFLNELRHRRGTALTLRVPMRDDLPASRAVRGEKGVVEGFDYRHVAVMAALRAIPDSPWFLVAKIDQEELDAPLRRQALATGAVVSMVWFAAAGTTFKIYLPAHQSATSKTTAGPHDPSEIPRGSETVLLAEDQVAVLALNRRLLETLGYTVLAADSPAKALDLARSFTGEIHLLLTDVVMPGMSGRDLQRALAADRPGIKCLFASGYAADVIAHHGVLDVGVAFLQKPFSRKDLARKVREALDGM